MTYLVHRMLLYVPIILLVTILVFLLMRVIPGDPALLILAGTSGDGTFKPADLAQLRTELGTDKPLHVQYSTWLWGLLRGDLGTSLFYRTPITREIGPRIPATLELALLAVGLSILVAVLLGALSALKQGSVLDYLTRMVTFTGISVPIFVTGLVVVYLLVRLFNWFPPLGDAMLWEDPWTNVQ